MKRILFLALLALGMSTRGQITLEHKYDTASDYHDNILMIVNFAVSGEKYVRINVQGKTINLYNLNHSLFKSISFANFPPSSGNPTILYLSQNLFTVDSKIDFMYLYDNASANNTSIYNEDGTLIFQADSLYPWEQNNTPQEQYPIYNTAQGTKMILSHQFTNQAYVYSLPGMVTAGIQETNNNLLAAQSKSKISNAYPNPTTNSTKIDYTLPDSVNEGEIVFYNLQGTEVKRFKVDKTFSTLLVSTADIAAGTYLYQLQTSVQSTEGKKMVVIK